MTDTQDSQTPSAADTPEDLKVVWRKSSASSTSTQTTPDLTQQTVQEGFPADGDWPQKFQQEQARADDYFLRWQRAQADMSNMRRRNQQEREELIKYSNAVLISDLLPVLDSFDRALATMPSHLRDLTWIDGILLVERQLRAMLEKQGLTTIVAEGQPFDPTRHEAIMHEETADYPDETVIAELQKGYMLNERVLRPSMVKVAKAAATASPVIDA